jgi:hypothetical protein
MSAISSIQLPLTSEALIRCTGWLGFCWLGMFIAWLTVLMLWIRQLGRYNRAYRKYQQSSREQEKAYSEYQKTYGEPPENLRLLQKEIQDLHLRLRDIDENPGMTLKLLRRLGLILGKQDKQLPHQGQLAILVGAGVHDQLRLKAAQLLNNLTGSKTHKRTKPNAECSRAGPRATENERETIPASAATTR